MFPRSITNYLKGIRFRGYLISQLRDVFVTSQNQVPAGNVTSLQSRN